MMESDTNVDDLIDHACNKAIRRLINSGAADMYAVAHSIRFRRVATGYARQVALAYEGDIERAMSHGDADVAETVAAWEEAQGMEPLDWPEIGRSEQPYEE